MANNIIAVLISFIVVFLFNDAIFAYDTCIYTDQDGYNYQLICPYSCCTSGNNTFCCTYATNVLDYWWIILLFLVCAISIISIITSLIRICIYRNKCCFKNRNRQIGQQSSNLNYFINGFYANQRNNNNNNPNANANANVAVISSNNLNDDLPKYEEIEMTPIANGASAATELNNRKSSSHIITEAEKNQQQLPTSTLITTTSETNNNEANNNTTTTTKTKTTNVDEELPMPYDQLMKTATSRSLRH